MKKFLFYFLNVTWGATLTTIGAIVALVLLLAGKRPQTHGGCVYFTVGQHWGGLELGLFFITDQVEHVSIKNHEFGHAFQNALWGPLYIPVIFIPSMIRYWLRTFKTTTGKFIYTCCVCLAMIILNSLFFGILFLNAAAWYAIDIYMLIIMLWLLFKEVPQYDYAEVAYDDIWFERQASEWGEVFISKW